LLTSPTWPARSAGTPDRRERDTESVRALALAPCVLFEEPMQEWAFIGVMWTLMIVYFVHSGLAALARRRELREIPLGSIDTCEEGRRVKLHGKVVSVEAPLVSPFSGRTCAAFVAWADGWKIEAWKYAGKQRATLAAGTRFELEDHTGKRAIVDATGIIPDQLAIRVDSKVSLLRTSAARLPGLAYLGLTHADVWAEQVLEPGAYVTVIGVMRSRGEARVRIVPPASPRWFHITDKR
jgi:hypothetical protein